MYRYDNHKIIRRAFIYLLVTIALNQATIHTDTLNEAGFVESTIAAFKGRTIHTYHSEGAGGGHAPDSKYYHVLFKNSPFALYSQLESHYRL
jgi:hypothetical protein